MMRPSSTWQGCMQKRTSRMASSEEFPGGITNGAHWYPLWGGMQVRAAASADECQGTPPAGLALAEVT